MPAHLGWLGPVTLRLGNGRCRFWDYRPVMGGEVGSFLLVSHDAGGTVAPMLALAEALVARDHRVVWLTQPSVAERATSSGCEFVGFSALPDYDHRRAIEEQLELSMPALTGRSQGDDVLSLLGSHDPAVVVVDPNLTGALAAVEGADCASAVLLHSLYATFTETWFAQFWAFMNSAINETRAAFGRGAAASWAGLFSGHDRIISAVPSAFDTPEENLPEAMRHFGFLVPQGTYFFPSDLEGTGPVVLASLSTTYMHHESRAQAVLDALADLPVRCVLTTGGAFDANDLRPPPNALVVGRVHHLNLLAQAEVVVTHGGLGTVAAALSLGVPLVCVPIGRDQPINAERVQALGAGLVIEDGGDPDQISAAVARVLAEDSFRHAAQSLARLSAEAGGAEAVAGELEGLL